MFDGGVVNKVTMSVLNYVKSGVRNIDTQPSKNIGKILANGNASNPFILHKCCPIQFLGQCTSEEVKSAYVPAVIK